MPHTDMNEMGFNDIVFNGFIIITPFDLEFDHEMVQMLSIFCAYIPEFTTLYTMHHVPVMDKITFIFKISLTI